MKPAHLTIDDYIVAQPSPPASPLHGVRAAIRKAVPGAVESISYNMPAGKLRGARLLYCAAWKHHSPSTLPPNVSSRPSATT
jgi:uncharacterized protein YdhG (YjbR/CyaY superfamily)